MPELPEVETIVRGLQKQIVGKKIVGIRVILPKIIRGNAEDFITLVSGTTIQKVWRRGKMIVVNLSDETHMSLRDTKKDENLGLRNFLKPQIPNPNSSFSDKRSILIHLKLSGQLVFSLSDAPITKHTHIILDLSDGYQLRYLDMRQFGYLCLTDTSMVWELTPSGQDPFKISGDEFKALIQSKKTRIKPFLLNQSFISGIGNIYADEILHKAGIHPLQHTHTLSEMQIARLYQSMQEILRQAIEQKGSSISDYVDSNGQKGDYQKYHQVYQWQGQPCLTCYEKIVRVRIGGRSSHFCPNCQQNKGERCIAPNAISTLLSIV